jgi:lipopolysaccharide/colanic/teichoic acid biosynthesis glycosyltransferase
MRRDSRRPRSAKPLNRVPANDTRNSLGRGSATLGSTLPTKRSPSPLRVRQERFVEGLTRFGDLVIACALLVFILPLMVAIAVGIRCEGPGPILVWQHRIGSDGQLFNALRFRTSPASPAGTEWFRRAQRTRVGEVLWRAHLDGLPMVINVLRGEMTILGSGKRARLLG